MANQQPFLEILTAAFGTGEIKPYAISGGYFEILDCAYPVTVNLIGLHGELKGIMRNAEASFYLKGGDYHTITIESPQAQLVRFAFGTSEAGTRRTAGVVQVVDGGKARTLANAAFSGYVSQGPVAAQFAQVQLWNPVGSGKRVMVEQCTSGSAAATVLYYGINAAPLATLVINAPSKLSGGAASSAQMRQETNAAPAFATASALIAKLNPAGNETQWEPREPVVLLPGYGLVARCGLVNQDLFSSFEFYEETI